VKLVLISAVLSASVILALSVHAQETENEPERGVDQSAVLSAPDSLIATGSQVIADTAEGRNAIVAGMRVNGFYDDAAFSNGRRMTGDYQYSILPNIGLRLFQPHTQWNLDYAGGVTFDQKTLSRGLASHNVAGELQHNFTRHLLLHVREGYIVSSNPFVHLGQSLALTSPGQLNSLVLNPQAEQIANSSSGDLTYQFSQHSSLGFDGTFSALRFRHVGNSSASGLIDTRATSGRMFYVHEVSGSQKLGVEYQLQDLRFQHGRSRTTDQRVLLFDEIILRSDMRIAVFAGPDRSHSHSAVIPNLGFTTHAFTVLRDRWSPAAGVTYTWKGAHAGLRLSAQRSITDGGGLLGATLSNVVSLEIEKKLTPRWSLSLGGNYFNGHSIDAPVGGTGRLNTKQVQIGVSRSITSQISAQLLYQHIQQGQGTSSNQLNAGSHNQVEFSLSYSFTRLLRQ